MESPQGSGAQKTTQAPTSKKHVWILVAIGVALVLAAAGVVAVQVDMRATKEVGIARVTDKGWVHLTPLLDDGGAVIFESENEQYFYLVVGKSPDPLLNNWRDSKPVIRREASVLHIALPDAKEGVEQEKNAYPIAIYRIYRNPRVDTLSFQVGGEEKSFLQIIALDKLSEAIH